MMQRTNSARHAGYYGAYENGAAAAGRMYRNSHSAYEMDRKRRNYGDRVWAALQIPLMILGSCVSCTLLLIGALL